MSKETHKEYKKIVDLKTSEFDSRPAPEIRENKKIFMKHCNN